ncbi:ASCH domain-containing protein [Staphylococcus durrellii]|uniref:ASCH domain-containing protein n=1 Tax=Staphylococcus durrellii TaxID=2781773 RepID=UPI00189FFA3C|nr:ASCH domain-containing protein [Staphylococcus durrellii]MBF7016314.1 ASCH domain-containing protein [Staphylococcus durrellii]
MEHHMKLKNEPYQKIKDGTKTIEIRLHDEKRQQVRANDIIIFKHLEDENKTIKVKVKETVEFPSFQALLKQYTNEEIGAADDTQLSQNLASLYNIYTQRDELNYGVLAISIRLIK